MNILIPITKFGKQGGFRVLSELSNHWIDEGNTVTFLAYLNSPLPYFPTKANILWYDNKGILHKINNEESRNPKLKILTVLFALYKSILKSRSDIILATLSLTSIPIALAKINSKKYYYIQAYEPEYYKVTSLSSLILNFLSRISYSLKLVQVVNSPLYFDYKNIKSNKLVYPGINFSVFKPFQKDKNNTLILGCIGRKEPYKGTSYVIEAYKLLRKEFKHTIELHIAFGSDDIHEPNEGIFVITPINDYELAMFYNNVDIVVAPGTVQLGAVHYPVIEAMACKTAIITTDYIPANKGNSWLVPIKNSVAIADAVKEIIKNPELTNKKILTAFEDVKEFDWKIVSKKMLDYFRQ
jgi:glycosyltransferase involved in cell wall biosynthesis